MRMAHILLTGAFERLPPERKYDADLGLNRRNLGETEMTSYERSMSVSTAPMAPAGSRTTILWCGIVGLGLMFSIAIILAMGGPGDLVAGAIPP